MIGESKLLSEISGLKKNAKSENVDYLTGYISALSTIEGIIARQDKIGGWISCSDRLPVGDNFRKRFDGEYYYKHLLVSVNEEETPICVAYYDQESEQWSDLDGFRITPIAWQPLPKPYKLQ